MNNKMRCKWLQQSYNSVAINFLNTLDSILIPENAAIVFDIDQTLLDWNGNPIESIVYLYHIVKNKGIHPVIITARQGYNENIDRTLEQLKNAGIIGWKFMYFLPPENNDIVRYKRNSRKNVHERGLNVIMSIGDETWDIGEYGGYGFIVPKCNCSSVII